MIEDSDILLSIKRDAETGFRLLMSFYREPVYWHISTTVRDSVLTNTWILK